MLSLPLALNFIFAVIVLELIVLSVWLVRRSRTDLIAPLVTFLLSGALLMVSLRIAADSGDQGVLILSLIALSFPAHLATLILVWRAATKP